MKKDEAKLTAEDWTKNELASKLKGWARDGLTMAEIAHHMGIAKSTLYEWRKKNEALRHLIDVNREVADRRVEDSLYQAALDGNTTAMIFWLKNRKPAEWRDRRDIDVSTSKDATDKLDDLIEEMNDNA